MTTSEKYVTAAYCVVFGVVLLYVVLIALRSLRRRRLDGGRRRALPRGVGRDGEGDGRGHQRDRTGQAKP